MDKRRLQTEASTDFYYHCTEIQHPKKDTKPSIPQSKKTSVGRREIQQGSYSIKEIGKSEVGTPEFNQMMETLGTLQRCWSEPWEKAAIVEIVEQQKETLDLQLDLTAGEQGRPQDDADDSLNDGTQEDKTT